MPAGDSAAGSATQVQLSPVTGKYVSLITVVNGQIQITYSGSQVNQKILGLKLSLSPGIDQNNDIVWVCGTAPAPTAPALATAPPATTTTIPNQYLPSSCHP